MGGVKAREEEGPVPGAAHPVRGRGDRAQMGANISAMAALHVGVRMSVRAGMRDGVERRVVL